MHYELASNDLRRRSESDRKPSGMFSRHEREPGSGARPDLATRHASCASAPPQSTSIPGAGFLIRGSGNEVVFGTPNMP